MSEAAETTDADYAPGAGHNLPPTPFDERKERTESLIKNANVWLTQCPEITSEEQAGRASDFKQVMREAHNQNEVVRKAAIDPLRGEMEAINIGFRALSSPLTKAVAALDALLGPWLRRKEAEREAKAKAEREESFRLQREAADKTRDAKTIEDQVAADEAQAEADEKARQAAATARGRTQVRGEVATRATSLRGVWKATAITDLNIAFSAYSEHPDITAVLLKLASADARSGRRRIPGFKVEEIKSVA